MNRFSLAVASTLFALVTSSASADTIASGYRLSTAPNPSFGSVVCTLGNGDVVTFDGQSIDRWKLNGTLVLHIGSLPAYGYPSFVLPTPDGASVVVGESLTDGIWLAALDASSLAQIASLHNNYAADFASNGDLIVSASTSGAGLGNFLVRVTLSPPSSTPIGNVSGPSGPIAFATNGDLYYATQSDIFPQPPGTTDIVRWSAAQVSAGNLTDANASIFATAFDGGAAMDFDPTTGKLYLAETNFGLSENRIVRVQSNKSLSPVIVEGQNSILSVQVINGASGASFDAYQPSDGSNLRYSSTDFFSVSDLITARPQRPTLTASGAGTLGLGPVTLTLTDGVPNGTEFIFFCPQSATSPFETKFSLPNFFFFTGMTPSQIRRIQFLLPTDAQGTGSFTFWNPGTLQGQYAFQSFVGTPTGNFLGSSTTASF